MRTFKIGQHYRPKELDGIMMNMHIQIHKDGRKYSMHRLREDDGMRYYFTGTGAGLYYLGDIRRKGELM